MDTPENVPARAPLWARLWPLAVTILIFAFIFSRIPFEALWDALSRARLLPFFALMGVFALCFFLVDTFVLSRMVRWFHGPIRYRELLPVRASTYLVSLINTQLAQAALALYIYRRFRTPLGRISGTIATLILLEATTLLLFATLGLWMFPGTLPGASILLPLGLAAVWTCALLLARGIPFSRLRESPIFHTLRSARFWQMAAILLVKGTIFLLSIFVHRYALSLFGIEIPFLRLLIFLPVVFLAAALPVTVAHLGTSQAAWIFFFSSYAPEADLLAYSLASHLTFMLANGLLGLIFLPKAYADLFVHKRQDNIERRNERGK